MMKRPLFSGGLSFIFFMKLNVAMYRIPLIIVFFSFFSFLGAAFAIEGVVTTQSGVDLSAGYRSDHLEWNIAGDSSGLNPNVLSELTWEDVEIFQLQSRAWIKFEELPYFKRKSLFLTHLSFGKIIDGNVKDSDYAADNRSDEWSRSVNQSNQGFVVDISGAWGTIFEFERCKKLTVTPLIGYGFNMQALSMTDGEQTVSEPSMTPSTLDQPLPLGTIPGLDSTYTAYWYGPWLGLNIDYQINDKVSLSSGFEYHVAEYYAQADWNLRSQFAHPVSFEHEARGVGTVWKIKGLYTLDQQWSLLFDGIIQNWKTGSGTDRTFFSDESVSLARLNEVRWESYALMAGIQYCF